MRVDEIMSKPVVVVSKDATLEEAARLMLEHKIGCVPVVNDQGGLSGIVSESDFAAKEKGVPFSTFSAPQVFGQWVGQEGIERIYEEAQKRKVREIMTGGVVAVTEGASIDEAVKLMLRHDVNRIPVVRDGVPVGVVARHDLLRLILLPEGGKLRD